MCLQTYNTLGRTWALLQLKPILQFAHACRDISEDGIIGPSSYRHIYWVPCLAHQMDLVMEKICKIKWLDDIIKDARESVIFIKYHHFSQDLFRQKSSLQLVLPGAWHATYIAALQQSIQDAMPVLPCRHNFDN